MEVAQETVPATGIVVTTVPVPPVTVREAYRPHRPVGYRYESLTELTQLSGTGMKVLQKSQNCPVPVRTRKNTPGIQKPILYPTKHTVGFSNVLYACKVVLHL